MATLTAKPHPLKQYLLRILFALGKARYCPVCELYSRAFHEFGLIARQNAKCWRCGSLERHRLVWTFFRYNTNLFRGEPRRMLHVAPEPSFSNRLKTLAHLDYLTADLMNPSAMVKMDITDIQFPNDHFDVIYCSHVLEHVPEDRKAMREFRRVLSPNGWAVLMVPITTDTTFEDATVTDPRERERLFGQNDHVRRYGPDFESRLTESGFDVAKFGPPEVLGSKNLTRLGVETNDTVFYCT